LTKESKSFGDIGWNSIFTIGKNVQFNMMINMSKQWRLLLRHLPKYYHDKLI